MKYHVIVSGEGHDCQLFVGFEGKPEDDATAADVIAALKANPEARAEVLDALGEPHASRHLDVAAAIARAEQAERERDEARHWLAAHKAAAGALVDPITGHGFFMLIGKGDDGEDGWFFTFGGPYDSYTLCERDDDVNASQSGYVAFQRERYDHDTGYWVDGVESVDGVLVDDGAHAEQQDELDSLRARLAKAEKVVEAALRKLEATRWKPTQPMRDWQVSQDGENHAAVCYAMSALRALDNDSGGSGAALGDDADPLARDLPPEPAGSSPRAKADSGASGVTPRVDPGTPGPTVGAIPAAGADDPLAAICAVLALPLTEEDRKRIEGVVSRLRPEQPRGGLLSEPWERRPTESPGWVTPATRREVEELRVRVERLESGPRRVG